MQHSFTALGLQLGPTEIIVILVVLALLFVGAVIIVGVVIFVVMRKKKQAKAAEAAMAMPDQLASERISQYPQYQQEAVDAAPEVAVALDQPPPTYDSPAPVEEMRSDYAEAAPVEVDSGELDFDPSRTVAITRENTVTISYGFIKFVSGALAGQQFDVNPEGSYIGRESTLAQIVVPDPRSSKRHLWIGVRDGLVRIVDQDSRNGTFVNDPKSERITEAVLTSGDTVILGESDVARFEYLA